MREQILAEALDEDHLQTRLSPAGELYYAPNQEVPWTGWVKATEDDVPYALWQMQDGKRHGIFLKWYDNQQNREKVFYKNGVENDLWTFWTKNGEKRNGLKHEGVSLSVAFSPDGKTLASGGWDKTVRLWDVATGTEKKILRGHLDSIHSVAFSPDGKTLASGGWDKTVRLWDVATGTEKKILRGHLDSIYSVAFSPDGKTLASGSSDGTVGLWDVP